MGRKPNALIGKPDMQRFVHTPHIMVWLLKEAYGGAEGQPVKWDMRCLADLKHKGPSESIGVYTCTVMAVSRAL